MASWSSDLFVLTDGEGHDSVSAALPLGLVIPSSHIRRYRASGPYMPIGWPLPTKAGDAAAWMAARQAEGFVFEPLTI